MRRWPEVRRQRTGRLRRNVLRIHEDPQQDEECFSDARADELLPHPLVAFKAKQKVAMGCACVSVYVFVCVSVLVCMCSCVRVLSVLVC